MQRVRAVPPWFRGERVDGVLDGGSNPFARGPGAPGPGDRAGPVRPDRPGTVALGTGLVGRPSHEPDPGRPGGQGPVVPVHRRDAGADDDRVGPEAPGRISRRGGGPGPLVPPPGPGPGAGRVAGGRGAGAGGPAIGVAHGAPV